MTALLGVLEMPHLLMAMVMYGTGMRVTECLQLRVCDVDVERALIHVRGKGAKERRVMLPEACVAPFNERISAARQIYDQDRLHDAGLSWPDHYLFPSLELKVDPVTRAVARGHMTRVGIYHALRDGARKAGLPRKVTPHMLRHAFAEHMIEDGVHILTVQELLGHARLSTTMIYTHPMNRGGPAPESPLAFLDENES